MSDLHVVALITAKPGSEDVVKAALEVLAAATREEPGCVSYFLHASAADPSTFITVESWKSKEDLDGHLVTEHMKAAVGALGGSLAGAPQIHPLIPVSS